MNAIAPSAQWCRDCPKLTARQSCRIGTSPGTVDCAIAQEDWADSRNARAVGGREPDDVLCGTCQSFYVDEDGAACCLRGTVYWGEGCAAPAVI